MLSGGIRRFFSHVPSYLSRVKIVEVGPRDGLQSEQKIVPEDLKIKLINDLSQTGLTAIESTSFVSPKWIKQFADNKNVFSGIKRLPGISYPVLVPNKKGFDDALSVGATEMAIFTTPSESFSKKNTNLSVAESFATQAELIKLGLKHNMRVRAYVSCVLGCPYEGNMQPHRVAELVRKLLDLGCYEISLGDTIGRGTPETTQKLLHSVLNQSSAQSLALHCHDTNGLAIDNISVALDHGIRVFDSSVGGLGGCPYAGNATGNVATEKVLAFMKKRGFKTGVDADKINEIATSIRSFLGKDVSTSFNMK